MSSNYRPFQFFSYVQTVLAGRLDVRIFKKMYLLALILCPKPALSALLISSCTILLEELNLALTSQLYPFWQAFPPCIPYSYRQGPASCIPTHTGQENGAESY
jgi:hypothetical protein